MRKSRIISYCILQTVSEKHYFILLYACSHEVDEAEFHSDVRGKLLRKQFYDARENKYGEQKNQAKII